MANNTQKLSYTISNNKQFNSFEINFDGKPDEATRAKLKAAGYRWHSLRRVWYGYKDITGILDGAEASATTDGTETTETAKTEQPHINAFGVKVGDLFVCDWGYEQTNINFFQVVALVGAQSVRVREVSPQIKQEEYISSMSRDVICEIPSELLPPDSFSVFITNQADGDIKRLAKSAYNGETYFKVGNGHHCEQYKGQKLYESWYA